MGMIMVDNPIREDLVPMGMHGNEIGEALDLLLADTTILVEEIVVEAMTLVAEEEGRGADLLRVMMVIVIILLRNVSEGHNHLATLAALRPQEEAIVEEVDPVGTKVYNNIVNCT